MAGSCVSAGSLREYLLAALDACSPVIIFGQRSCISVAYSLSYSSTTEAGQNCITPSTAYTVPAKQMADEAKAASLAHKRWILEFMKQQPDMKCSYDAIVTRRRSIEERREHGRTAIGQMSATPRSAALTPPTRAGDTLAAMLKLLKRDKVLAYKQMFLMYPMHKDGEVTLINPHASC